MNGNRSVGGEFRQPVRSLDPTMSTNRSDTVYVGRSSFRIEHDLNSTPPPMVDAGYWFSGLPSDPAASEQGGDGSTSFRSAADDADKDGAGGIERERKRVKPSSWKSMVIPVAAFSLGMFVSPLSGSSLPHQLKDRVRALAPLARTVVKDPGAAPARRISAAEPIITAGPGQPIVAPADPRPEAAPVIPPVAADPAARLASVPESSTKARVARRSMTRDRVAGGGGMAPSALDRRGRERRKPQTEMKLEDPSEESASPASTAPVIKPWVDPWAS